MIKYLELLEKMEMSHANGEIIYREMLDKRQRKLTEWENRLKDKENELIAKESYLIKICDFRSILIKEGWSSELVNSLSVEELEEHHNTVKIN